MQSAPSAASGRDARRPLPARAQGLIVLVTASALALLAVALLVPHASGGRWTFILVFALVLASDRLELYAARSYDMRIATLPMVAAALLLPAPLVWACGAAFALHRLGAPIDWRQRLFNGMNHALSGLAAWGAVHAVPGHEHLMGAAFAGAGVAATVVYALCTWGLLVAILHLARDLALGEMRLLLPGLLVAEGGLGALGIVVAALWRADPVLVPFAVLPLVLIWTSLQVTELRQEASVDVKTGLFNARHLREALAAELDRASRYERPLSVLVADLDFLREVNNEHGHLAGDAVIAGIGEVLRAEIRTTDVAARFGGEEFVVLLPETSVSRALQLAERVRRAVAEHAFDCGRDGEPVHVTISVGVASFPADAASENELLEVADAAVYAAKARGRNRVAAAHERSSALRA